MIKKFILGSFELLEKKSSLLVLRAKMLRHLIVLHSCTDVRSGGNQLPPPRQIPSQSRLFFTLCFLTATARLAATALLFTLPLLAFTFLSFAVFLALSGSSTFTRLVGILLCFHITFRFIITSE
jgi:hypothetical protein